MGVIAREYEVTQLVQLLQTLGQDSPMYPMLVSAVIDNMGLSNREEIMAEMKKASEPNPEAQQAQQAQMQVQMETAAAQLQVLQAQAAKYGAEAQETQVNTQLAPQLAQAKLAAALSNNLQAGDGDDAEFAKRAKIAELMLKEKDIVSNERIATMQMKNKSKSGTHTMPDGSTMADSEM